MSFAVASIPRRESVLEQLFLPSGASSFLEHAWPGRSVHARGPLDRLPAFFSSPLLHDPHQLDRHYRGPVEVTKGRMAQYEVTGARATHWVRDLDLAARFRDLHDLLEGAPDWLRQLEGELGVPDDTAELHAFMNPPGVGLRGHCDRYEHIAIHVSGRKRFRVRPNPAGSFVSAGHALGFPAPREAASQYTSGFPDWRDLPPAAEYDHELEPGDVLFVPRGWYHDTVGLGDGPSLTLVVQVKCPTYLDAALDTMRGLLAQDARWRTPLHGRRRSVVSQLSTLLRTSLPGLADLDVELAIARQFEKSDPKALFRAGGRLLRCPSVDVTTRALEDGSVEVTTAEFRGHGEARTLTLGSDAAELVASLVATYEPLTFVALCKRHDEWDEDSLATIVDFLIERGVMFVLPVERL